MAQSSVKISRDPFIPAPPGKPRFEVRHAAPTARAFLRIRGSANGGRSSKMPSTSELDCCRAIDGASCIGRNRLPFRPIRRFSTWPAGGRVPAGPRKMAIESCTNQRRSNDPFRKLFLATPFCLFRRDRIASCPREGRSWNACHGIEPLSLAPGCSVRISYRLILVKALLSDVPDPHDVLIALVVLVRKQKSGAHALSFFQIGK